MPWTANDAEKHTHKATTPELKELWAKVANERLEKTGDERPRDPRGELSGVASGARWDLKSRRMGSDAS
jgi:hypothetical protein